MKEVVKKDTSSLKITHEIRKHKITKTTVEKRTLLGRGGGVFSLEKA